MNELVVDKKLMKKKAREKTIEKMKRYRFIYLLLLPAIILVFVFHYLPLFGIIIAFQDYDIIGGIAKSDFVGFKNFIEVFSAPKFLSAIKNTVLYSGTILLFGAPFPITLAILFNELKGKYFKKTVQTISYLPYFLSWVSVVGMVYGIFATDGTFNDLMIKIVGEDWERINILREAKNFIHVIFWSDQWKNIGWNSIVYLAAIAGIDQGLYEAAKIDGCGRLRQIWYITLPCILPTFVIMFIMSTGSLINSNFEQVLGFQNIYIQEQTETVNTLIYRQGILGGEYSTSTAFGLAQGLFSLLLVTIANKLSNKVSGIGIW